MMKRIMTSGNKDELQQRYNQVRSQIQEIDQEINVKENKFRDERRVII